MEIQNERIFTQLSLTFFGFSHTFFFHLFVNPRTMISCKVPIKKKHLELFVVFGFRLLDDEVKIKAKCSKWDFYPMGLYKKSSHKNFVRGFFYNQLFAINFEMFFKIFFIYCAGNTLRWIYLIHLSLNAIWDILQNLTIFYWILRIFFKKS